MSDPMTGWEVEPNFGDYYREIYAQGSAGERAADACRSPGPSSSAGPPRQWTPALPPTSTAAPARRTRCGPTSRRSAAGGSCPRCCATCRRARPAHDLLGTEMPAPVLLAPIGVQTLVHPEGELATRAGGRRVGAAADRQHRVGDVDWRRSPRRTATHRAGTSSTGPTMTSSPPASSAAPRRPATRRSC